MCIIIYRDNGNSMNFSIMKQLWALNSHGAGYWIENKDKETVRFKKGFLEFDNFESSIRNERLKKTDRYAIHFRLATHGGINQELCHPFDVSHWSTTKGNSKQIIMHNGIIDITPKAGRSDTAEYVVKKLKGKKNICQNRLVETIKDETAPSRLLLYDNGTVKMTGEWHRIDGYYFSNYRGAQIYENARYNHSARK